MMFILPIGDDNSSRRIFPLATYALFLLNLGFFYLELRSGEAFIDQWALIPNQLLVNPFGNAINLITSIFLHAGWLHLGSNMLYLLIFGDNVENRFGHFKFIVFYLLSGVAGNLAQSVFTIESGVPIIGASGAIAGVLGAYLLLHPTRKIRVLLFIAVIQLPALIVIGVWFILQLLNGLGSFASTTQTGGIAYLAHIGGFVAGFLLTFIFRD